MRVLLTWLTVLTSGSIGLRAAEESPSTLQIIVVPTIQYAHEDIWTKTPNGRGPASAGVGQVVRGQPVHILVFATQFSLDASGHAEVSYDISFVRPDGQAGTHKTGLRLISSGPALDSRNVVKAAELAIFIANQDDRLGEWRVVVEATDRNSAGKVRRELPFRVVGDESLSSPVPDGTAQDRWLMQYHHKPVPQQLLAAVRLMAEQPPARAKPKRDAENGAWLGFFEQVLSDNPWLLPHVVARLELAVGRERELLITLLAFAKREDRSFSETLPPSIRDAVRIHAHDPWPVPTKEPLQGTQLDVLWGRFFASGRFEPIRDLVAVLAFHPHKDALENYKKLAKKPREPPIEVYKAAVFGAAAWSLRSNIEQDKVVRDYCEGILLRQELPAAEHAWLAGAFQAAVEKLQKRARPATPGAGPD